MFTNYIYLLTQLRRADGGNRGGQLSRGAAGERAKKLTKNILVLVTTKVSLDKAELWQ